MLHHKFNWFALVVKPRRERVVAKSLQAMGHQVILPVSRSKRRWSDRIKELETPLFPGYVFCRFDVSNRLPLLMTPGVRSIVGFGNAPVPVKAEEIAALQKLVSSLLSIDGWPFTECGCKVRIESGPLAGVEGILQETAQSRRLVVSITLLCRSVAVEVDPTWLRRIEPVRRKSMGAVG